MPGGVEELVVIPIVFPSHEPLLWEPLLQPCQPLARYDRVATLLVAVNAHVDGAVGAEAGI